MIYSIADYKSELDLLCGSHKYDRFYECYSLLYAICAELDYRGNDYPYENWEYRSGASTDMREPESYWYDMLEGESTEQLITLGNLINMYLDFLHYKGYEV